MNLATLKTLGGIRVQRAALQINKYAPEILTGVGISSVIAGTVLIARASTKLEAHVEDFEEGKYVINEKRAEIDSAGDPQYDDKEIQKDLFHLYLKKGFDLTKLYGPGVTFELAGLFSILAAHGIMQRRQVALIGAYKAVETAFGEYRKRVSNEIGEAKELDIYRGITTKTIEDPETGKKTKVKDFDPTAVSSYLRVFDETNDNWRAIPGFNMAYIKNQQNYANDLLQARGHLFLNEVYDSLGFERIPMGQSVGWVIEKDGVGDNYVDFNIFGGDSESSHRFVNGLENSVWLDFNVDGIIIDKI